jgi:hypothetical protein
MKEKHWNWSHAMNEPIVKFRINGVISEKEYNGLPFGRRIDAMRQIIAFQEAVKSTWLSQKRQTYQKAIKEFLKLNDATEFYCKFHCSADCKDDTFQIWFR